jgi:multiple sugar transport system permease protein
MGDNERYETRAALPFVLPFIVVYAVVFIYPTYQMVAASFTDSSLTLPGDWVGLDNYRRLAGDKRFWAAVINTGFFVLMTALPSTLLALAVALMVNRLKGVLQAAVMALFFLPYILPVSVVTNIWYGLFDSNGILRATLEGLTGRPGSVFQILRLFLPAVAVVTVWSTLGLNVLLFIAGLKNISPEIYEAATIDNAGRWRQFRSLTWPLIWPVTALVLTIQLILQIKIFDQAFLLSPGANSNVVLVQYIYTVAFSENKSGYGSTIAVALFLVVMIVSVLQYQTLRARGAR